MALPACREKRSYEDTESMSTRCKEAFPQNQPQRHLHLELAAYRTVRKNFMWPKWFIVWHFVPVARQDYYKVLTLRM